MLLTTEEAEARLSSSSNIATRFSCNPEIQMGPIQEAQVISMPKKGREFGKSNMPTFLRTQIAVLSHFENQKDVAKEFSTTQPHVSNIKNGKHEQDLDAVEQVLGKVRDVALEKLMASMGLLDSDKLSACSARDLSGIAANMSKVVEKTLPKQQNQVAQVNLVIYAPAQKEESSFRTIEI
jgi:hypothetical protein